MKDDLRFPVDRFDTLHFTVRGQEVVLRAWHGIPYCAAPVDKIQRLDLYAPECFFHGDALNGYTAATAPIFMPNTVGGYMPGPPGELPAACKQKSASLQRALRVSKKWPRPLF